MQINIMGLVGLLLVGLKLTGYIAWSWWLVLLPFYIGIPVALAFMLVIGLIAACLNVSKLR